MRNDDVGRAVSIGREQAVTLLSGWVADRALLRCQLEFPSFAAGFEGRAVEASPTRFALMSDDKATELVLPIADGFTFGFTDLADWPDREFDNLLVIFYPYKGDPDRANRIVLAEKKE